MSENSKKSENDQNNEENVHTSNNTEESVQCVNDILERIEAGNNVNDTSNSSAPKKLPATKKTKLKNIEDIIPRGKPKSGRPWKSVKQKFSTIKKSIYRLPFEKKMELRNEIKHIKELSNSIKEERKKENEMKKQRRLQNAERRLENERKSEVVQIIKNPAKLKRMRKKQLRMIEKRDLSKVKVV